ncbi:dickkopf-related protein 3-like [Mixophyes fleayi]|uniref:dickkopf-related protein 3-like n=1 Tax=Mixophyes fleayi TaxID=3061075 RepID=UPI003F4E38AC
MLFLSICMKIKGPDVRLLSGTGMPLLLPAFLFIILGSPSSPASLSPEYHSEFDGAREALNAMAIPYKDCNDSRDCPQDQYCHASSTAAICQECKTKEMHCQEDEECCSGWVCAEGGCTEALRSDSGGTRCHPAEDSCAPGFCCYKPKTFPFPVCVPFPSKGMQCQSQTSNLLKLINFGADYDFGLGRCPCAEGLVCTSKGNLISTCEKPDEVIDFTNYREESSIFQPIVRRDEELTYYDVEFVPWPSQDDQLAFVDFPRAAEESEREAKNAFNMLSVDVGDNLEDESLHFDDHVDEPPDPSQVDFQELKQLANEMGQYFGPGFY